MDLITKLQNLKETTQSREVRDLCETYISELRSGNNSINESQVIKDIESKTENKISPIEALRNEELERSRERARMIAESWGGVNEFKISKNSGSYVDGVKEEEKLVSKVENSLNEALTKMAEFDRSAASFVQSNKVENLGVLESILAFSSEGIFEHSNFKILCENYVNLLKNKNLPEYLVVERFISDFSNFSWDNKVKNAINKVTENVNSLRREIEVSKALYQIQNTGNSDFYSPVKESINKWLVSESKSVPALSKEIGSWSFNPIVKNLINTLTILESNESKVNIPITNGNSEVKKIYSPVLVENNKTIFAVGKTLFEGSEYGIKKLSTRDISTMDKNFLGLLESFYSQGVKADDKGISIYVGDTKISIVEENEEKKIYINENSANFSDFNQLAKLISVKVSKGLGINESKVIYDVVKIYENFDKIVELDFAKTISSKIYEGASVSLIKWNGRMFLQRVNEAMRENSLFEVNGSQAANIVKEFLNYDISEGLTEFLDGERKIKSIMINDRKKVMENITLVESEMKKIEALVSSNPLYKGSKQLSSAYSILEKELKVLKSKWSTINAELDILENHSIRIEDDLLEDSKFSVGDYVKVGESGNTGKVISVDTTSGSYTVLLDSGKTGDYGVEEIESLEDAFQKGADRNEEEDVKESNQPLAKAPSAGKVPHGKNPSQVMKSSISIAPSSKDQEKDGKKDFENLKDANLEEAPLSKNKLTDYEVNDEIGYNLEESQDSLVVAPGGKSKADMSTHFEKSGLNSAGLAKAPGKEEGDSGYKMDYPEPKGTKKPEVMGNSNLASAPGMGKTKVQESDLSKLNPELSSAPGNQVGDSGYQIKYPHPGAKSPEINNPLGMNLSEAPEKGSKVPTVDTTNPNFANSPGKAVGDAGYNVEYPDFTSINSEIRKLAASMNLAKTPSEGADGEVSYELNDEMGYNLSGVNEGFERPSPELKKN